MALELIQNADDAEAKQIVFDIQEEGLLVRNSGIFTYCGELGKKPCPHQTSNGYSCDFHRISDFGSGEKLSHSENIGRFGIGFSSVYQIADNPEIRSAGISLTLVPEDGKCYRKPGSVESGTTFFLPWATVPSSRGRQALGVSHVTPEHIQQVTEDCKNVLRESLLFLRHLEKAELRRNGEVLLLVELARGDDAELIVSFEPKGDVERWFIVRADAASQTKSVFERYPQLEPLDRKTEVAVAIRVDPEPLDEGLFYAFLPTRQLIGLPFHLNADFFPEDSRKAIIFEGHQHQQAWNELLVRTSASALVDDLVGLRNRLGHVQLWELLSAALVVAQDKKPRYPEPLKSFWEAFKAAATDGAELGYSEKGEYKPPSDLLISRKTLSKQELSVFHQIGGELISETLKPHRKALGQLGVKELTLERFVAIANESLASVIAGDDKAIPERLNSFFQPLWAIVEELLVDAEPPSEAMRQSLHKLKRLPFILDTDLGTTSIYQCRRPPGGIIGDELASSFKFQKFVNGKLALYTKIYGLIDHFDIGCAAGELKTQLDDGERSLEELVGNDLKSLRIFYTLLGQLDETGEDDDEAYETLRSLPIWRTGNGVSSLEHVLLPGDFEDPTGQAELLDQSYLSSSSKKFIERKLKVKRQTIEEYIRTVVPLFFGGSGPEDLKAYKRLILTLADHAGLLDNDEIRLLLIETPLVPTSDGGWQRADHIYHRTDELVALLGDYKSLWVDEKRLPSVRSIRAFIANLGLLTSAIARHLVNRILAIAASYPPDLKARKASEIAFYELCNDYDEDRNDNDIETELNRLVSVSCLPVIGDTQKWYMPEETYAPFRYQAFQSQVHILDFKNAQKLNRGLLDALSISKTAETCLVVNHLLHCVDKQEPASNLVYQMLDERAKQEDSELSRLRGKPCIYLDAEKRYVRPNQVYLIPQSLGKYSFSVPEKLDQYKDLFEVIGVKRKPEPKDYIDIVLDIVEENYLRQAQISTEDKAIYQYCMNMLVQSWDNSDDRISPEDFSRLKRSPTILNVTGLFCHPDEVLLHDSEWHAGHFGDEISSMLCKPDPTFWDFFTELGVEHLTRRVSVELEYIAGVGQVEEQIRDKMLERSGIFARMLHDKKSEIRRRLNIVLQNISVLSHDEVRIVALVDIGDAPVSSEPTSVKAFCDESMERLVLARPLGERVWLHIFNVMLHRLVPEEPASQIAQISMNFFQMIGMSVVDAEKFLTEANIPVLEVEGKEDGKLDLVSPELGDIGEKESRGECEEGDARIGNPSENDGPRSTGMGTSTREVETAKSVIDGQTKQDINDQNGGQVSYVGEKKTNSDSSKGRVGGTKKKSRNRDPNKVTWDRKLISYVKQRKTDGKQDGESSDLDREYKRSIEAASRAIACAYEKERGRVPEEMPQTHAGFDIVSRREGNDEIDRYIEVKGTSGEWNNRGVSISRLQFSNAQNLGNRYWLYVVEHALDDACARIHAIQSPAMKVDSYMFDGEWRKVADDEVADPTLRFREGIKVDCGLLGIGTIEKVENRGLTKSLIVDFGEAKGKKYMALNLKTMTVIEEDNGPDST